VEILAQSSTAFVLTHNFLGTYILGASRGRLSDSVASCFSLVPCDRLYRPTVSTSQFPRVVSYRMRIKFFLHI